MFDEKTIISMRVFPTDLDILWHVNNGIYFSMMDYGRWDMVFRNGIYDMCDKNGWYPVVAGETIKFKKSLQLWDKFTIETQNVGFDERYFYIKQDFMRSGELMASGFVKVRFLKKKGGPVAPKEILDCFKDQEFQNNRLDNVGQDWFELETKFGTF